MTTGPHDLSSLTDELTEILNGTLVRGWNGKYRFVPYRLNWRLRLRIQWSRAVAWLRGLRR